MNLAETVKSYFQLIADVEKEPDKYKFIAGQCYFIDSEKVLSMEKSFGNSRYPYAADGMTVWATSSGNITVEESTLHIFPDTTEGREPRLAFFLGEKAGEGYFPVSLTGCGKQLYEDNVKRYIVFTPYATYYLTKTKNFNGCVRVFIDKDKQIRFSVLIENVSREAQELYLSAYFNPLLQTSILEAESKWFKAAKATDYGYRIDVSEQKNRHVCIERFLEIYRSAPFNDLQTTTSHADYCGGFNNQLCSAIPLKTGLLKGVEYTTFKETAIAGELIKIQLAPKEQFDVSYTLKVGIKSEESKPTSFVQTRDIDACLQQMIDDRKGSYKDIPAMGFTGMESGIDDETLNRFFTYVFRQVEFCSRAKNYAGAYIGIRDIFQQLEASLMWIPEYVRRKIVEALNFIGDNGRAPRQYSYPATEKDLPAMDMRPFIDQGNWIISTVYKYLCYTGDYSILKEECGYYRFEGDQVRFSDRKDSVLEHLLAIVEYLVSKIDKDTRCLRALYGDWNDALDGLGRTQKEGEEYGNGVSVMASLHLYQNLVEMIEILGAYGKDDRGKIERYQTIKEELKSGLLQYAVETNERGDRKIIHGWGEDYSYKVGSFRDNDGENRDSLTVNAFWVLSGALKWDESIKKDILNAYDRLKGKYGLKTFEPYFAKDNKDVGRIIKLPKGTAENAATYIHGTMFAVWSLFQMGEAYKAWEQINKLLPVTHATISTSPFVMPNSYIHNIEEGLDGQSMSDWFTGSGCVLLKVLMWEIFGVKADLEKVYVRMPSYAPFKQANIELTIKKGNIRISYEKKGCGRKYFINGKEVEEITLLNSEVEGESIRINIID